MTLIEVMVAIAILIIGSYFLVKTTYNVSAAQREIQDRMATMAEVERVVEEIMAYSGSNSDLYTVYDAPPDVVSWDSAAAGATVPVPKLVDSNTAPGEQLEVRLTCLRDDPI